MVHGNRGAKESRVIWGNNRSSEKSLGCTQCCHYSLSFTVTPLQVLTRLHALLNSWTLHLSSLLALLSQFPHRCVTLLYTYNLSSFPLYLTGQFWLVWNEWSILTGNLGQRGVVTFKLLVFTAIELKSFIKKHLLYYHYKDLLTKPECLGEPVYVIKYMGITD